MVGSQWSAISSQWSAFGHRSYCNEIVSIEDFQALEKGQNSYQLLVNSEELSVISGQWLNGDEIMGIENCQPLQPIGQHPRKWHNAPREGWRESDAMKFITAIGKQASNFRWANFSGFRC